MVLFSELVKMIIKKKNVDSDDLERTDNNTTNKTNGEGSRPQTSEVYSQLAHTQAASRLLVSARNIQDYARDLAPKPCIKETTLSLDHMVLKRLMEFGGSDQQPMTQVLVLF